MGISFPHESKVNRYVTPDLAFMFHYFFTRKFWMVYNAQALVCCPGGVGTCDELFEFLTLKQTGKLPGDLPVVLLGVDYWNSVVNWEALANYGVVAKKDVEDLFITDDVDAAFAFVTERLAQNPIFNAVDMTKFVPS
jgi:predicted Rossmann-fold nucleotide-binding protein